MVAKEKVLEEKGKMGILLDPIITETFNGDGENGSDPISLSDPTMGSGSK